MSWSGQCHLNLNEPINPSGQSSSQSKQAKQSIWSTPSQSEQVKQSIWSTPCQSEWANQSIWSTSSQPEQANQSIWSIITDTSDIVTRSSIHCLTPAPTNRSAKSSTSQRITWWRGKVVDYLSHTDEHNIIQNMLFFKLNGLLATTYPHLRKYSFPSTV